MTTLNVFYNSILLFTNSLQIKIVDLALATNIGINKLQNYPIEDNKEEWKYYLNLAGMKHATNNDVKIKLIETGELVELSKNILDTYTSTRLELRKQKDYYENLISLYPLDKQFIRGCMYPVTLEKVMNAKDGDIIAYDETLIEENESYLIRDLTTFIKGYLRRYNVTDYLLTDELYLPGLLLPLYSSIHNKIANLRISKIGTNEVHSFFLEHYFRSRLDLWESVSTMSKETQMWLYKNLDYLMRNTGSNKTLDIILDKIFEKNGIGVGEYILDKNNYTLLDVDITKSNIKDNGSIFIANKLNNSYVMENNTILTPETMVNLELTSSIDIDIPMNKDLIEDIVNGETKNINNNIVYNQKTKVLDINTIKLFKNHGVDLILSLMDNWLYLASTGRYIRPINFIDPNTKINYELTPLEGYYFLIKLLLKINNNENLKLQSATWTHIINGNVTNIDSIINSLFSKEDVRPLANRIKELLPNDVSVINDANDYLEYINKRIELYKFAWELDSNCDNGIVSGNIKTIIHRLYENGVVDLRVNNVSLTIDELLATTTFNFDIPDLYDIYSSVKELFLVFTGININLFEDMTKTTKNYMDILNKLTSYTIQVIKSVDDNPVIYVPYTHNNILKASEGLVTVMDAEITDPLSRYKVRNHTLGNNFIHSDEMLILNTGPKVNLGNNFECNIEDYNTDSEVEFIINNNISVGLVTEYKNFVIPNIHLESDNQVTKDNYEYYSDSIKMTLSLSDNEPIVVTKLESDMTIMEDEEFIIEFD